MNETLGKVVSEVAALHDGMETLDYYAFLGVPRHADYLTIREAFHQRAQYFHPDRFVGSENKAVKTVAYAVYKRVTEAYNVLCEPSLRVSYDAGLSEGRLRIPAEERTVLLGAEERKISNVQARAYFRSAKAKIEAGDRDGALIDVRLGLTLEQAEPLTRLSAELLSSRARGES